MGRRHQIAKDKRKALREPSNMTKLEDCLHILEKVKITEKHPDEDTMEEVRREVNAHLIYPPISYQQVEIGTIKTYFKDERKRLKDKNDLEDDSTIETKSGEQLNALQKLYEETKGIEEWKKCYEVVAEKVRLRPKIAFKWFYRKEGKLRSKSVPKGRDDIQLFGGIIRNISVETSRIAFFQRSTRANPTLDRTSDDGEASSDRLSEWDNDSDEDKDAEIEDTSDGEPFPVPDTP